MTSRSTTTAATASRHGECVTVARRSSWRAPWLAAGRDRRRVPTSRRRSAPSGSRRRRRRPAVTTTTERPATARRTIDVGRCRHRALRRVTAATVPSTIGAPQRSSRPTPPPHRRPRAPAAPPAPAAVVARPIPSGVPPATPPGPARVPVEDDAVGSPGDRRRVRRRHVGRPRSTPSSAPHRPGHRARLPARLPARRRPPPVAVPGHVHRPHRQRHPARPGIVRPQHGDGPGGRCFTLLHRGTATAPTVVRARHRRAAAQPVVLAARRRDDRRSPARVLGGDGQDRRTRRPPDGLGWVPVRTWLATYDASTLARLAFRPAPDAGRRADVRLRRVERRRAHATCSATRSTRTSSPPGRLLGVPVLGDRDVRSPGCRAAALDAAPEYRTAAGWSSRRRGRRADRRPLPRREPDAAALPRRALGGGRRRSTGTGATSW